MTYARRNPPLQWCLNQAIESSAMPLTQLLLDAAYGSLAALAAAAAVWLFHRRAIQRMRRKYDERASAPGPAFDVA